MKHLFSIILLSFFLTGMALAQDSVGTIKKVNGNVRVQHKDTLDKVVPGRQLFPGDVIYTGKNSAAGVSFMEGTRISLGDTSEFALNDVEFNPRKKKFAFDVFLKKGTAIYTSGKLGKLAPEKVTFRTPKAIVGVRGTKFMIKIK